MLNNAEFLSRLNAYESDKREMGFHLRKSVVTVAKKIIRVNGTFIAKELWFQQTFVSGKRNSMTAKLVFKGKINSGSQNNAYVKYIS